MSRGNVSGMSRGDVSGENRDVSGTNRGDVSGTNRDLPVHTPLLRAPNLNQMGQKTSKATALELKITRLCRTGITVQESALLELVMSESHQSVRTAQNLAMPHGAVLLRKLGGPQPASLSVHILWSKDVHDCVHSSPPFAAFIRQVDPLHTANNTR
jgi:hypothetical protein